jgi:hypothetical protein
VVNVISVVKWFVAVKRLRTPYLGQYLKGKNRGYGSWSRDRKVG